MEALYKEWDGYDDDYMDEDEYEDDDEIDTEDVGEPESDIPANAFPEEKKVHESAPGKHLDAQREEVEKLSAIIRTQLTEIADLHKKNMQLYQEIAALESRISAYERELAEIKGEKEQLYGRQRELETELAGAREQYQTIQEQQKALRESIEAESSVRENCEMRLYQLEHSKSWKLTEPLRRILGMVKQ